MRLKELLYKLGAYNTWYDKDRDAEIFIGVKKEHSGEMEYHKVTELKIDWEKNELFIQ